MRRHDYFAVLLVTAAAYETVRAKLDRVTKSAESDRIYRTLRYRVAALRAAPQDEVAEQPSAREPEVLTVVAEGLAEAAIAHALCTFTEKARTHVTDILGSHDRANAVHLAHERALLDGAQ